MLFQLVGGLGVDHFAHALAHLGAGHAADGRTHDGTHRAAGQAHGGPGQRAGAGTGARGQVVLMQLVVGPGVHHLAHALAGHAAGRGADGGTGHGAEGPGHRAHGRAGQRTAGGAHAGGHLVLRRLAAGGGVEVFGHVLAGQAAGDGADDAADDGAHRAAHGGADGGTCGSAARGAHAGAHRVRTGFTGDGVLVQILGDFLGHDVELLESVVT